MTFIQECLTSEVKVVVGNGHDHGQYVWHC